LLKNWWSEHGAKNSSLNPNIRAEPENPWQYPPLWSEVLWALKAHDELHVGYTKPAERLRITSKRTKLKLKTDSRNIYGGRRKQKKVEGTKGKNRRLNEVELEFPKRLVGGWDEGDSVDSAAGGSRFFRISPVEFFDKATSRDMRKRFPEIIRFRVTLPFD